MPSPLTAEDKKKLQQTLKDIEQAKKDIALAERAGIDMSSQKAALQNLETVTRQMLQTYFPQG